MKDAKDKLELLFLAALVSADNNTCAEEIKANLDLIEQVKDTVTDKNRLFEIKQILLNDLANST